MPVLSSFPLSTHRRYKEEDAPGIEIIEAEAVCGKYKEWRGWMQKKFGCQLGEQKMEWESDIFSPILLNLALALWSYHQNAYFKTPDAEVFQYLTPDEFCKPLYESVRAKKRRESFFLFDGKELSFLCLA
ncbi:hypothetical protein R3P38DRAFT_2793105 [Favolaschia claudopus]|uniref:Uncharacterized protein n=1 Tax=Favolaschia claudopus TaxID=2862362 RepID=A0AAW0ADB9_9AGAR